MKNTIFFFLLAFCADISLAQVDTAKQQQPPPPPLSDSTSGWQLVFSNPDYTIVGLQFFPENTVYAIAYNGSERLLMRSFDMGNSWDTLPTPIPIGIGYFTSPQVGYATPSSPNV